MRLLSLAATALAVLAAGPASAGATGSPFLGGLTTSSIVGETIPPNGDLNPYGVATVPRTVGSLVAGDTLISNFNNGANEQGRGSTIVQMSPSGALSVFAEITQAPGACPGGIGLTTALTVLPSGFVVVGSLPTSNGKSATMRDGCLIILDPNGKPIETIAGRLISGPWDLTATNFLFGIVNVLYVSNVLNGPVLAHEGTAVNDGTIVRIVLVSVPGRKPIVVSKQVIAEGFPEITNESALVIGPTGLAATTSMFNQTLFVNDTFDNRIAEVPDALFRQTPVTGAGRTVTQGGDINDPLGMTLAPNGNILTANGENAKIVETSPSGEEVASFSTGFGPGGLFGLDLTRDQSGIVFVNDNLNNLNLLH
jgi:hypothetical protein